VSHTFRKISASVERTDAGVGVSSVPKYTWKLEAMAPRSQTRSGEIRVADSHTFLAAKNISGAVTTIKPGGLREMHWHPNASEWQY
jgi:oxalate decarboxylase